MMEKVKNDTVSYYYNGLIKQLKVKIDRSLTNTTLERSGGGT